ncbi:unnamed protein product [Vicia faba]|uniref:Uncharacterized protein n=1 Tax=Vicia faba TaxID=3906 RepID=A0AAV0ZE51_VICFA|nr:unnamed protein product [Vicia faba]
MEVARMDPNQSFKILLSLYLCDNAYIGKSLHFQDGWFKNLKELTLVDLLYLNYILIDEGALPSLRKLHLVLFPRLETVPNNIQPLKKLGFLYMEHMTEHFMMSIAPHEGKEHWIFKHVALTGICTGFAKSDTGG